MADTPPALVSIAEAARLTGLDAFAILSLAEDDQIPSEVRRLVDIHALRRYVATQESA